MMQLKMWYFAWDVPVMHMASIFPDFCIYVVSSASSTSMSAPVSLMLCFMKLFGIDINALMKEIQPVCIS